MAQLITKKQIDETMKRLGEARARANGLQDRLAEVVYLHLIEKDGLRYTSLHIGLAWECEDSPTGHCVYDEDTDRAHDDCIFCHGPEERK